MDIVLLLILVVAGAIVGGFLFAVPGVTVHLVTWGILCLVYSDPRFLASPLTLAALLMSLTVSYSLINTIPAIVFSSPDSSTLFLAPTSRRNAHHRCAYEECVAVGTGGLIGIVLLGVGTPLYFYVIKYFLLTSTQAYLFPWMAGAVIIYMVAEENIECVKAARISGRRNISGALAKGPLVFLLVGIFGVVFFLFTRGTAHHSVSLIAPVFMGLLLIPNMLWGVLLNGGEAPGDKKFKDGGMRAKAAGTTAGYLCGHVAMLLGFLAPGHGTFWASRIIPEEREQAYLIAQGAAKTIYHVGAFLIFFVPYCMMQRGGMAWLARPFIATYTVHDYFLILAVVLISGGVSYRMLPVAAWLALKVRRRLGTRVLAAGIVVLLALLSFVTGGFMGLALLLLGSAFGSLPFIVGCRPHMVFAFWLVPNFLGLAGLWPKIATLLGLQ